MHVPGTLTSFSQPPSFSSVLDLNASIVFENFWLVEELVTLEGKLDSSILSSLQSEATPHLATAAVH